VPFSWGKDTFAWTRDDVVNANGTSAGFDRITDFQSGDRLDFSALFSGRNGTPVNDLVHVRDTAQGIVVSAAVGTEGAFVDTVVLRGIHGLDLDDLVHQHAITI